MGGLGDLIDSFWNREFVARKFWMLISVVTFGAMMLAGVLELDLLARFVMVVGWFVLAPVFLFFGKEIADAVFDDEVTDDADEDPVAVLRDRYAHGEISEAEFERRVERLLETEQLPRSADSTADVARSSDRSEERFESARE